MAVTDLEIISETGEIVSWEDFGGFTYEPDGTEDIAPSFPIVKVVQGTSTMPGAGRHAGDFWSSDTEEFAPVLDVVALVRRQTRAYFPEGAVTPSCLSTDGKAPLPNQPLWHASGEPQPVSCAACPLSAWGDDGSPPPCKASDVLLIDRAPESEMPDFAQLRFSGKSIRPLTRFIATKCKPKSLPLYAFRLRLSTNERAEDGKKWQEIQVEGKLMTPADAQRYSAMLAEQRARFELTLAEGERAEGWEDDTHHAPAVDWGDGESVMGPQEDEWRALNDTMKSMVLTGRDVAPSLGGRFDRAAFMVWREHNPQKTIGTLLVEASAEQQRRSVQAAEPLQERLEPVQ